MTPILGIWASQISGHLYTPVGSYDSLATVTVPSGGLASITFAGIPAGYRHLQIRTLVNCSTGADINMYFNGDTGSNYRLHYMEGNGSSVAAASYAVPAIMNSSAAGFTAGVIDILDYASTTKNKTSRSLFGYDANGSGRMTMFSNLYFATPAATTSLTLTSSAGTFVQYSQFALYGIK